MDINYFNNNFIIKLSNISENLKALSNKLIGMRNISETSIVSEAELKTDRIQILLEKELAKVQCNEYCKAHIRTMYPMIAISTRTIDRVMAKNNQDALDLIKVNRECDKLEVTFNQNQKNLEYLIAVSDHIANHPEMNYRLFIDKDNHQLQLIDIEHALDKNFDRHSIINIDLMNGEVTTYDNIYEIMDINGELSDLPLDKINENSTSVSNNDRTSVFNLIRDFMNRGFDEIIYRKGDDYINKIENKVIKSSKTIMEQVKDIAIYKRNSEGMKDFAFNIVNNISSLSINIEVKNETREYLTINMDNYGILDMYYRNATGDNYKVYDSNDRFNRGLLQLKDELFDRLIDCELVRALLELDGLI